MRLRPAVLVIALTGCHSMARPGPALLDQVATRYVVLALSLGKHDPNYVDAYYGPDSLRTVAERGGLDVARIRVQAESLLARLSDSAPASPDTLIPLRHRYLRRQLSSMVARTRMLSGEAMSFDEEARALYDAEPPHFSDAHFDSLLTRLDSLLPGREPLAQRYRTFHARVMIPPAKVDTVFKVALDARGGRQDGQIHHHLSELRDQLQPGEGPGGPVG